MRPTGRLHLGNYVGALENWVRLQNEGWENFHMVADWHMLTTGHEDTLAAPGRHRSTWCSTGSPPGSIPSAA